jgi:hypothetical protein
MQAVPGARATGWSADWVPLSVLAVLLAVFVLPTRADPDLWGHLRYGLDIVAAGDPRADVPYAFTQDHPFVYHEWLGGVTMAATYSAGGIRGLVALKLLIVGPLLFGLAWHLRDSALQVRVGTLLILAWALLPQTLTIRPQLWSLACAGLVLVALHRERHLWVIPGVVVVWTNLHGGWIIGIGAIGLWSAYHVATRSRLRYTAAIVGLASLAATLANPHGVDIWRFIAETVRLERSDVQDWQPLWMGPLVKWGPWLITSVAATVAIARRRLRLDRLATIVLFAYASLMVVRLVPFFVLIGAVYLPTTFPTVRGWRFVAPSRAAARLTLVPVLALAIATALALPHPMRTGCLPIQGGWTPDLAVGASLREAHPTGRLAVPFNWGQYALWHVGPALQVSMDGRRETVYREETIHLQREVVRDSAEGRSWLAEVRPDYVWMPVTPTRASWLRSMGYRIDIETSLSILAVKPERAIVQAAAPAAACFPG